jgi:hypothetical protein
MNNHRVWSTNVFLRPRMRKPISMELHSSRLRANLDPAAGGCVRSLYDVGSDTELLFQSPWPTGALPLSPADPVEWTRAWPGGWHLLFPNAGEPCNTDGVAHGFHGAASIAIWDVVHQDMSSAGLRWRDEQGLEVIRYSRLLDNVLVVTNVVVNHSGREAAFVFVEHVIFGPPLVGEGLRLHAPGGNLLPLSDTGEALTSVDEVDDWPYVHRGDIREDWSISAAAPFSRFGAVVDLPTHSVTAINGRVQVRLDWSGHALPHLWVWHENMASRDMPDGMAIRCLGLEPASVLNSLGLAAARESGHATTVPPDGSWHSEVRISVVVGS